MTESVVTANTNTAITDIATTRTMTTVKTDADDGVDAARVARTIAAVHGVAHVIQRRLAHCAALAPSHHVTARVAPPRGESASAVVDHVTASGDRATSGRHAPARGTPRQAVRAAGWTRYRVATVTRRRPRMITSSSAVVVEGGETSHRAGVVRGRGERTIRDHCASSGKP